VAKNATVLYFFVIIVPSVKERAEVKDYGQHLGKGRAKVNPGKFLMVAGKNGRIGIAAGMEDSRIPKDILFPTPDARKGNIFFPFTFYNSPSTQIL
jgi:hypothetical protein